MRTELLLAAILSVGAHLALFTVPWGSQKEQKDYNRGELLITIAPPPPPKAPPGDASQWTQSPAEPPKGLPPESQKPLHHEARVTSSQTKATRTPSGKTQGSPPLKPNESILGNQNSFCPKTPSEATGEEQGTLGPVLNKGSEDAPYETRGFPAVSDSHLVSEGRGGGKEDTDSRYSSKLNKALPRYELNPKPSYPEIARRRGYEGTALLSVLVLKDGSAGKVTLVQSSGHDILDQSASEAVKKWRFYPATIGHEPVEMEILVPIRFELK